MVPAGSVNGWLSALALFRANRQRLDKRYLFIGAVNHFFKRKPATFDRGQSGTLRYTVTLKSAGV
jgi:hypothetical protein